MPQPRPLPDTTGELAESHSITAPEVSRHLSVLKKKAGLVTTRRRGRYVLHQLDLTVVARLGSDFLEGILAEPAGPSPVSPQPAPPPALTRPVS
ncbi:hypothetical protein SBADM41S_01784 [Streptomyces badius]